MRPSIFQQSSKSLLSSPQAASKATNTCLSDRPEYLERIKRVSSEKCISVAALDKGQTSKKSLFSGEKTHPTTAQKQELIEWLCGNSSKAFEDVMKTSSQSLSASSSSSIRLHSEPNEVESQSIEGEEPITASRRIRRKKPQINLTENFSNDEINSIQNARTDLSLSLISEKDQSMLQERKKPSKIKLIPPENPKVEILKQPYLVEDKITFQKEPLQMSSSKTNWLLAPMNFEKTQNQRQVSPANSSKSETLKKIQVRVIEDSKDTKVNPSLNQTMTASPKFSVQNVYDEFIRHSSPVQSNLSSSSSASKLLNAPRLNSDYLSTSMNSSPSRFSKHRTPLDEVAKAEASQGKGVHSWKPSVATVLINQNNKQFKNEEVANNLEDDDDDGLSDFEPRPKARTLDCYPASSSASLQSAHTDSLYKSILKNPQAAFEAIFSDSQQGLHSRSKSPKKVTFAN